MRWSHGMGHMGWSHWMSHMGWSHGMVKWDGHMGWSHGMITWDESHGMVTWYGHMGWSHGIDHMGWSRLVVPSKLGDIIKMCDIQISDKISKTPCTEMQFSQDSHMLAI